MECFVKNASMVAADGAAEVGISTEFVIPCECKRFLRFSFVSFFSFLSFFVDDDSRSMIPSTFPSLVMSRFRFFFFVSGSSSTAGMELVQRYERSGSTSNSHKSNLVTDSIFLRFSFFARLSTWTLLSIKKTERPMNESDISHIPSPSTISTSSCFDLFDLPIRS
jgi:hypothetical protein